MSYYISTGGGLPSLNPSPIDVQVRVDSGAGNKTAGTLVQFDLLGTGTDITGGSAARFAVGTDASSFTNVITPAVFNTGFFAVLLEDVNAGSRGLARVLGPVTATAGTGNAAANSFLSAAANGVVTGTLTGKVIGISAAAITAASQGEIWFDGISGIGNQGAAA